MKGSQFSSDQIGFPPWADLARVIFQLLNADLEENLVIQFRRKAMILNELF